MVHDCLGLIAIFTDKDGSENGSITLSEKKYKSSHWGGSLLVGVNIYHLGTTIYTWGANMYQKLSLGLYPFKN